MVTTQANSEANVSLSEFLTTRARGSSDARLAIDTGAGFVVSLAAALWRGPAWYVLAAAGFCFLSYGAWGIIDRELGERRDTPSARWLLASRAMTVVVGLCSAIFLVLGVMRVALGRWMT